MVQRYNILGRYTNQYLCLCSHAGLWRSATEKSGCAYLDKAIEAVPRFAERISLFTKKLRLAQYADSTIKLGNQISIL